MKKQMKVSVVIPALNEEEGIALVIKQIPIVELNALNYEVEILVVDNGSTDKTAEIARRHGARVVSQPIRGYGNAYKLGFSNATGDIIATGDADMSYPLDMLPQLLSIFHDGNLDFLSTDRLSTLKPEAMTFSHLFGNRFLSLLTRVLFRWPFRDSQSGMWVFKRSIWSRLNVQSGRMQFSQELKVEAFVKGFTCGETPIEYRPRIGEVKLSAIKDGIRNMTQLFSKRLSLLFANPKQLLKNILLFGFFLFLTFAILNPNPFGNNPDVIVDESYFLTSSLSAIEKHTLPGWEFSSSGNYYGGPQTYLDTLVLIPALAVIMAFSGFSPIATKMWVAQNTGELLHLLRLVNGAVALGTLIFFFSFFKKRKIPEPLSIVLTLFLFLLLSNVLFIELLHTAKVWAFYAILVSAASALFIANEYYLSHFNEPFLQKKNYLALLIWIAVLVFFQANIAVVSMLLLLLYAILLKHITVQDIWEYICKYWYLFFLFTLTQVSFLYRALIVKGFSGGIETITSRTAHGIDWLPRLYNPLVFMMESHPLAVIFYAVGAFTVIFLILQKKSPFQSSRKRRYLAIALVHPLLVYFIFHVLMGFSVAPRYAIMLTIGLSFSATIIISEISKHLAIPIIALSGALFFLIGIHSLSFYWHPSSERILLQTILEKYNSPDIAFIIEPPALHLSLPVNETSLSLLSERKKNMERFKFLSEHREDMLRNQTPFRPIALTAYNEKEEREAFANFSSPTSNTAVWTITSSCNSLCTATETVAGTCFALHTDACGFMPNEPNVLSVFLSLNRLGNPYIVRRAY